MPHLESSDSKDIMKFTFGKGGLGIEREAYYAGWAIIDYWLNKGMTYEEIAKISEADMPALARDAILSILKNRE